MDRGELEERYIDTLWVLTCSEPLKASDDASRAKLKKVVDSFDVLLPDVLPATAGFNDLPV